QQPQPGGLEYIGGVAFHQPVIPGCRPDQPGVLVEQALPRQLIPARRAPDDLGYVPGGRAAVGLGSHCGPPGGLGPPLSPPGPAGEAAQPPRNRVAPDRATRLRLAAQRLCSSAPGAPGPPAAADQEAQSGSTSWPQPVLTLLDTAGLQPAGANQ